MTPFEDFQDFVLEGTASNISNLEDIDMTSDDSVIVTTLTAGNINIFTL